jgi:hypothetical protein
MDVDWIRQRDWVHGKGRVSVSEHVRRITCIFDGRSLELTGQWDASDEWDEWNGIAEISFPDIPTTYLGTFQMKRVSA